MSIIKIVSGGQTGADRGGLDAATYCNIPHGGWCPKGRKAEDGKIPARYLLAETMSADYLKRTERNVVDSDATVVFTLGPPSGGSLRTIDFCLEHHKPFLHLDIDVVSRDEAVKAIVDWLQGRASYDYENYEAWPPATCVLNVAGTCESGADGIKDLVMAIMIDVLITVNPECRKQYPIAG